MKQRVLNIVPFLLFFLSFATLAQIQKTEKFEINDFLGETEFLSATQGENLIIYFNTSGGILSYNGKSFKKLKNFKGKIYQVQSFQDHLFLASSTGLLKYNPETDSTEIISEKIT